MKLVLKNYANQPSCTYGVLVPSFNTSWVSCDCWWLASACATVTMTSSDGKALVFQNDSVSNFFQAWTQLRVSPVGLLEVPIRHLFLIDLSRDLTISQRYLIIWYRHNPTSTVLTTDIFASPKPADCGLSLCRYWGLITCSRLPVLGLQGLAYALASKSWGGYLPL
jgi:hypothetical protein